MNADTLKAYQDLMEAGGKLRRVITRACSSQHPLQLAPATIAKLREANEALNEAQRTMERAELALRVGRAVESVDKSLCDD